MQTLETSEANQRALELFRKKLKDISYQQEELEWIFPDGDREKYPTYSIKTYRGELQIGIPKSWKSRIPHLIRFAKEQSPLSPDVELNIPMKHDRGISGLYAENAENEIWLCSRGLFTAYRGRIKRDITFSHFDKWLYNIDDAGKSIQVIPVCSLSSATIADDIADFTAHLQELKRRYKDNSGETISSAQRNEDILKSPWGDGNEFEGKKISGNKASSENEYMHGPLCNQLMNFLKQSIGRSKKFAVKKNRHVDAAIVFNKTGMAHSIFEVKTASLPSSQIYTAVGQILYYKTRYGDSNTNLYLVLPLDCKSSITEEFIEGLRIQLLYRESEKFNLPTGEEFIVNIK